MKAVILAGVGGTRLWPLSTDETPKQFQKLVSDKTMLEETIDRLDFLQPQDIYIAINHKHLELTKKLCPQIPEDNIIVEPALRDTAPCLGFAASIIENRHPGEVMAVAYADHLIQNKEEFQNKVKLAAEIAQRDNTLNIVEVEASEPNTNYGYVKLGEMTEESVYMLDSFKEKPDRETAEKFIAEGNYLWNTGIYVWKAATLLEKFKEFHPDEWEKLNSMIKKFDQENISAIYPTMTKISIDYAIMEKVDPSEVRIIRANLDWSDIGNWQAIWEELSQSPSDNIERGDSKSLDCKGSLIYSDSGKPVRVIGLDDVIVVDTPEGLLVSKKSESKRIKELNQ